MPSIFEKQQAIYLRFYFRDFRYGWGFAIQPRIPAWFCSRRPNRAFARGAGGAFLPRRPPFQRYTSPIPELLRFGFYRGSLVRCDWSTGGVHSQAVLGAALDALTAHHAGVRVDRPRSALAIDRERARRAATRAHATANAHVHVVDDVPAQALGRRQLLLRIAHRYRLFDHGTQGRLGKCQQTHAVPTFPCS